MVNENEFIKGIESCYAYFPIKNKNGYEAFEFLNDVGIAIYFYFKDDKGNLKHFDDKEKFLNALNN